MNLLMKLNKKEKEIAKDRKDELIEKFSKNDELLELLLILREDNENSKTYVEENLVDLGERKAYTKIINKIFKKWR